MPYFQFLWLPEYEEHVTAHGASVEEVERIIQTPEWTEKSQTSDLPVAFGESDDGRLLACVYEVLDGFLVRPVTAFYVDED